MPTKCARRLFLWWLAVLISTLSACGEDRPSAESLSLRDWLALAPARVAEMSRSDLAAFSQRLAEACGAEERSGDEAAQPEAEVLPGLPMASAEIMQALVGFDGERAASGRDVAPLLRVEGQRVRSLSQAGSALNWRSQTLLQVAPLQPGEAHYQGIVIYDQAWSAEELRAAVGAEMGGLVQMEPALRRFLALNHCWAWQTASVVLAPAPQAPFVLAYVPERETLYLNPNVLFLLGEDVDLGAGAVGHGGAPTPQLELPDAIQDCVQRERQRCGSCLDGAGTCQPLFAGGVATEECEALARDGDAGFALLCYSYWVEDNLACFLAGDPNRICSDGRTDYTELGQLWELASLRTNVNCLNLIVACEAQRQGEVRPEPKPSHQGEALSSGGQDGCNELLDCFCVASEGLACGSEGSEGGSSGLCESDSGASGLCEGDAWDGFCVLGPRRVGGLGHGGPELSALWRRAEGGGRAFLLPLVFLAFAAWRD